MSIPSSGSSTWRKASLTSSFVGIGSESSPTVDLRVHPGVKEPGRKSALLLAQEANFFSPFAGEEMDAVHEANPVAARAHDEGVCPRAVCQEAHPAEKIAVRHSGRNHDHFAGRELLRREDVSRVLDSSLMRLFDLAPRRRPELRLDLA